MRTDIPNGNDGTGALFSGWGTFWDDPVQGTGVSVANTTYLAHIHGVVETGAGGGTLTPRFRSEIAGTTVTIKTGSWGALYSP